MTSLGRILAEETSIFRQFNQYRELSPRAMAFASPADEVPHWNSIYPIALPDLVSAEDCANAITFYEEHQVTGHVMVPVDDWQGEPGEIEEYFFLDRRPAPLKELTAQRAENLGHFTEVVQRSFGFDQSTADYFQGKMARLAKRPGSLFWIIYCDDQPAGCSSTFVTDNGAHFLFNVGVLPEFRRQRLGSQVVQAACSMVEPPVYTYTPTDAMAQHILPGAGFTSAGSIAKPTLHAYVAASRT